MLNTQQQVSITQNQILILKRAPHLHRQQCARKSGNKQTNKKTETGILFSRRAAEWIYLSVRMPAAACSLEILSAAACSLELSHEAAVSSSAVASVVVT
jgi:hypothetical protein